MLYCSGWVNGVWCSVSCLESQSLLWVPEQNTRTPVLILSFQNNFRTVIFTERRKNNGVFRKGIGVCSYRSLCLWTDGLKPPRVRVGGGRWSLRRGWASIARAGGQACTRARAWQRGRSLPVSTPIRAIAQPWQAREQGAAYPAGCKGKQGQRIACFGVYIYGQQ